LFPDEVQRQEVVQELARYGTESYEQEAVRVRLAVLKLAGADQARLHSLVDAAKSDFRDVLAWAEYPAQMKSDSWLLAPAENKLLVQQDRDQYEDWLRE